MSGRIETKVRNISELIDHGKYAQALKSCDQYLKEKSNALVLSFKAFSQLRQNQTEEAKTTCSQLLAHPDLLKDQGAMQILQTIYKDLGLDHEVVKLYEAQYQKNKTEENLLQLFFCYVKSDSLDKQKEIVAQLNKDFKLPRYQFWNFVILQSQVKETDSEHLMLRVVEGLMDKLYQDDKLLTRQTFDLYLSIIEQRKNWTKALEVLRSKIGEKHYQILSEKSEREATLLKKLNQFKEAHKIYESLLNENIDQWSYYLEYLSTGFEIDKDGKTFGPEALNLIKKFQEEELKKTSTSKQARGPFLAELELEFQRKQFSKLIPLLLAYFERFSDRPVCFADLRKYLTSISNDSDSKSQISGLVDSMRKLLETKFSMNVGRAIVFHQMCLSLGQYQKLETNKKIELIKQLWELHLKNPAPAEKEETENAPTDSLIVILSQLLQEVAIETKSIVPLVEASMVLEKALENSKFSPNLKLASLDIFSKLGTMVPAMRIWNSMRAKHILLDTTLYLILDDLIRFNFRNEAIALIGNLAAFHKDNEITTAEYMTKAFNQENYSQIKEFNQFKQTLRRSQQFAISQVEQMLLGLQTADHSREDISTYLKANSHFVGKFSKEQEIQSLICNQDYTVFPDWQPTENRKTIGSQKRGAFSSAHTTTLSVDLQMIHIRLKSVVVECLNGLVFLGKANETPIDLSLFESLLSKLNWFEKNLSDNSSFDARNWTLVLKLFRAVQLSHEKSETRNDAAALLGDLKSGITFLSSYFSKNLLISQEGITILDVEKFAEISLFITTLFSWTTLFLPRFIPHQSSSNSDKGSKKKKPQQQQQAQTSESTDLVLEAGKELGVTLKSVATDIQTLLTTTLKTRTLFADLLLKSSNQRIFDLQNIDLLKQLDESYSETSRRLVANIQSKASTLKSIK